MSPHPVFLLSKGSKFLAQIRRTFDRFHLEELGRSSGFTLRRGKLSAQSFVELLVFQGISSRPPSLEMSCEWLYDNHSVDLSCQSLDERFNARSVELMRSVFSNLLDNFLSEHAFLPQMSSFERIWITDATGFGLPQSCASRYPGSGGAASSSQIKLYLQYELLSGQIADLSTRAGLHPDNRYREGEGRIGPKELVIEDLGFYRLERLKKISDSGAYFLSRCKSVCMIERKSDGGTYCKSSLLELTDQLKQLRSYQVRVGWNKLPARLIIEPIPAKAYKKRIKSLEREAKKKGRTLSQTRKQLAKFNLFLTNASEEILPDQWVRRLYSIRWQIELIFKVFKSLFHIDKVSKMHLHRFECTLFGKLIAMIICWKVFFLARCLAMNRDKPIELSEWKGFQLIKSKFTLIHQAIKQSRDHLHKTINKLLDRLIKKARKEAKKGRGMNRKKLTPFDILLAIKNFSQLQNE